MKMKTTIGFIIFLCLSLLILTACAGPQGPEGPQGPQGPAGPQGPPGEAGPGGAELTEEQEAALEAARQLSEVIQYPFLEEQRRGCPACHSLVDEETGQFTLPYEAHERAEARGGQHPEVAPDGTSLAVTEEVNVTVCLQCHAPGTGDREDQGVIAPLALRDIVHPAHMTSQIFKLEFGGNCFTCHNVNGEGEFELLTQAVEVNEKGVPSPDNLPIPGAIELHEHGEEAQAPQEGEVSLGGRLYDKWWEEVDAEEPTENHPIWARQDTNTREGDDTWRCKECHGWDYQGAEGAYGSGSHFTGFPGVLSAQDSSREDLLAQLSGQADPEHDFSVIGESGLDALVSFLQVGVIDVGPYIDDEGNAVGGDSAHGEELFASTCSACHGEDGRSLNFGDEDEPEYVGTIALDNPWEFIHKARFGQPGTGMPAVFDQGWSMQDVVDLLAFSQTLPTGAP